MSKFNRRNFLKAGALLGAGAALATNNVLGNPNDQEKPEKKAKISKSNKVNIGFIGVGLRGRNHLSVISKWNDVEITAICDLDPKAIEKAQKILTNSGRKEAKVFTGDEYSFMEMLKVEEIDGVIISTPWLWHTRMAVQVMKHGKYAGVEVSAAITLEECWDLVDTSEATGKPCMIMENVCFAREALAVLNMIREGFWGIPLYASCGYRHDLRPIKFNDGGDNHSNGVKFGDEAFSEAKWRTQHSLKQNGDVYPTHGIGPVAHWFDINRGNRFFSLTATATKSVGLKSYIINNPKGGENHPNAKIDWKLGDIITSVIKTTNGENIVLTHDTNLPRPYSWGFTLSAEFGVWCGDYEGQRMANEKLKPSHSWIVGDEFKDIMKKYDHPLWKNITEEEKKAGHGGIDFFVDKEFVSAVKNNRQPAIDVYDAAAWSSITPLSEASIANNGAPQLFPDFTRGRWMTNKRIFGLEK